MNNIIVSLFINIFIIFGLVLLVDKLILLRDKKKKIKKIKKYTYNLK